MQVLTTVSEYHSPISHCIAVSDRSKLLKYENEKKSLRKSVCLVGIFELKHYLRHFYRIMKC